MRSPGIGFLRDRDDQVSDSQGWRFSGVGYLGVGGWDSSGVGGLTGGIKGEDTRGGVLRCGVLRSGLLWARVHQGW